MDPSQSQAQTRRLQRGSALLLSLLLTVAGAALMGLAVDVTSLLWARSHAQTTAQLAAESVGRELERHPGASRAQLEQCARATAVHNGSPHAGDSASVRLTPHGSRHLVVVETAADIFFLRLIRREPVSITAAAEVSGLEGHR